MLEPLREPARRLRACPVWPDRDVLQAVLSARGAVNAGSARLRLCAPGADGEPYEERIRVRGEMPFREGDWHDLFNALAWAAYPATKAAINDAHYRAILEERARSGRPATGESRGHATQRGRTRDALTVFDENGAIVISSNASLLEDLRAFRWRRLFVERRDEVRNEMRFYVFGHALFEKALRPYLGLTAHALLLPVDQDLPSQPASRRVEGIDALAAAAVHDMTAPRSLAPLPLLGVPGWWADNERPDFYDNAEYFRRKRETKVNP